MVRKAAKNCIKDREILSKKVGNRYRNWKYVSEKKEAKRRHQRERYHVNTDLNEKLKQ